MIILFILASLLFIGTLVIAISTNRLFNKRISNDSDRINNCFFRVVS